MIAKAKQTLIRFQRRWQIMLVAKSVLYALGPAVLIFIITMNWVVSVLIFIVLSAILLLFQKPWQLDLQQISGYIDQKLDAAAFSAALVLQTTGLSGLALIQQQRVASVLIEKIGTIRPKIGFFRPFFSIVLFVLISFFVYQFDLGKYFSNEKPVESKEQITFRALDSVSRKTTPPLIKEQKLVVSYPAYTNIAPFATSEMNIKALEGSRLRWNLEFDQPVDSVSIEFSETKTAMKLDAERYSYSKILEVADFYNFRFKDSADAAYVSDLFSVEIVRDQSPVIALEGLQPFVSFAYDDEKKLDFTAQISDDFGVGEAHIMATVSRGTGESVKFREERLAFDNPGVSGEKNWKLYKNLDLDALKMEPGDELYFYVETADLKMPRPNILRSETFFAVIQDTVSYEYAVEGTLGVDQMPDYFRSQRQLIIDTEKLIKNKPNLSADEFSKSSNSLGSEQSSLRLKYGKFMGDENQGEEEHEHQENENPLAEYMHDHDGSNEHNLVETDGEQAKKDTITTGKPNQFTQSLHSKMRQALNEMWASERHLRISEPRQSLPYQNRALELLQEIKNSARIYVHRIGYDPPPIKENTRLTGKIKEVDNYRKTEALEKPESEPNMRQAVVIIEQIITKKLPISDENRQLFDKAGGELAQKAIDAPGAYLATVQQLKWISESQERPQIQYLRTLQRGLLNALSKPKENPNRREEPMHALNQLLLQELENND